MTFSEAVTEVLRYLDWSSSNATTLAKSWINQTRRHAATLWNHEFLLTKATTTTVSGVSVYNLPDDLLEPYIMFLTDSDGSNILLYPMSPKFIANLVNIPEPVDFTSDVPPYRIIFRGNYFEIYPAPPAGRTITLYYYKTPDELVNDDDTDYFLNTYSDVIIWGDAWRGAVYLDDQQKIAQFLPAYQEAIKQMIARENRKKADRRGFVRFKTWQDFDPATLKRMFGVIR